MIMRHLLRKIAIIFTGVPFSWNRYYHKLSKRFYNNSAASLNEDNIEWIITKIKILTHELDKGLHMPKPRKGFGRVKAQKLVEYLKRYLKIGNLNYEYDAYLDAVEILHRYCESSKKYCLDTSFINLIDFKTDNSKTHNRLDRTDNFIIDNNSIYFDFKEFALSRHSVRYFKPDFKISHEDFEKVVEIARMSPSACNRQSVRLMLINDKKISNYILKLQGGTNGFENANNCILVMSDLNNYWHINEMNTAFIDAGIFTMNLLYSLKYYGIDSCPLIWDDNSERRDLLKSIIDISDNYYIMCIIAIGKADSKSKNLFSPRKDTDGIIINSNFAL